MRRAFTLIELLAIVAIIGIMVTAGVVSLGAGQGAARTRGATRDIFATIRQARSTALVTQQPCVLSYSTVTVDGETCAKVEITSARIFSGSSVTEAETLSGERVNLADPNGTAAAAEPGDGTAAEDGAGGGQSIEDILFEPIAADVVKGMAIQVKMADELLEVEQNEEKSRSMISAFSNVDALLGRYKESKKSAEEKEAEEAEEARAAAPAAGDDVQEPVSVVWEVNGRCEPHRVYVYPAGKSPDSGLCIKIDRFGAAKVLSFDEEDE